MSPVHTFNNDSYYLMFILCRFNETNFEILISFGVLTSLFFIFIPCFNTLLYEILIQKLKF